MTSLTAEQVSEGLETFKERLAEATAAYGDEAARLRERVAKLQAWLWANGEHSADSVTEDYVAMRDERSALKAEYDARDAELKARMEAHETWLLKTATDIGAESIKTAHGTAFVQVKQRFSCGDWDGYWAYIKETGRFDLLEKRPAQAALGKMVKDGQDLPPGTNVFSERVVTVRRS